MRLVYLQIFMLLFCLVPTAGQSQKPLLAGGYLRLEANEVPNSYSVEFVAYRDCDGSEFPAVYMAKITRTDGVVRAPLKLSLASSQEITPLAPGKKSRCRDGNSKTAGIESLVYKGNVNLVPLMGGHQYRISIDGCCRPVMVGYRGERWHFDASLDPTLRPGNSHPRPMRGGIEWICEYAAGEWNPEFVDADGDSLVIEQVLPAKTPELNLEPNAGFSALRPLNLKEKVAIFDPATGSLRGTAVMKGQASLSGLKIHEYRDGKEIGTYRMDRGLRVLKCRKSQ